MIAREADGSVRDGLSLLDQIFSFGGEIVDVDDVVQVLGLVDRKVFNHLAVALLQGDLAKAMTLLEESYSAGLDLKRFAGDLLQYFRSLMICQNCKNPKALLDVSDQELVELTGLAREHNKETVYRNFQLLMQGIEDMRYSSQPRLTLEMTFIKIVQAGQIVPAVTLLSRLDSLVQGGVNLQSVQAEIGVDPIEPNFQQKTDTVSKVPPKEIIPPKVVEKKHEKSVEEEISIEIPEQAREQIEVVDEKIETTDEVVTIATHEKDVRKNWNEFAEYVKERKQWMAQVLQLCENPREENACLIIRFDNPSDCLLLKKIDNLKDLTRYAQDFFQKELSVKISSRGEETECCDTDDGKGPREERRALANDPLVKMVTEVFDGKVSAIRTGPRFR
jgi:DNA polymerase-3 subunit gamma/tau